MPSEPGTPDTLNAQPTPQKGLANLGEAWTVLPYNNLQAPGGPHPSMRAPRPPHLSWSLDKAFPTLCCVLGGLRPCCRGERYGRSWNLLGRGDFVLTSLISVGCICCGLGVCV